MSMLSFKRIAMSAWRDELSDPNTEGVGSVEIREVFDLVLATEHTRSANNYLFLGNNYIHINDCRNKGPQAFVAQYDGGGPEGSQKIPFTVLRVSIPGGGRSKKFLVLQSYERMVQLDDEASILPDYQAYNVVRKVFVEGRFSFHKACDPEQTRRVLENSSSSNLSVHVHGKNVDISSNDMRLLFLMALKKEHLQKRSVQYEEFFKKTTTKTFLKDLQSFFKEAMDNIYAQVDFCLGRSFRDGCNRLRLQPEQMFELALGLIDFISNNRSQIDALNHTKGDGLSLIKAFSDLQPYIELQRALHAIGDSGQKRDAQVEAITRSSLFTPAIKDFFCCCINLSEVKASLSELRGSASEDDVAAIEQRIKDLEQRIKDFEHVTFTLPGMTKNLSELYTLWLKKSQATDQVRMSAFELETTADLSKLGHLRKTADTKISDEEQHTLKYKQYLHRIKEVVPSDIEFKLYELLENASEKGTFNTVSKNFAQVIKNSFSPLPRFDRDASKTVYDLSFSYTRLKQLRASFKLNESDGTPLHPPKLNQKFLDSCLTLGEFPIRFNEIAWYLTDTKTILLNRPLMRDSGVQAAVHPVQHDFGSESDQLEVSLASSCNGGGRFNAS